MIKTKSFEFSPFAKALVAAGCLSASLAYAATENVGANVTFVAAIALTEVNALDFGLLDSTMADTNTVGIAIDDTVTDTLTRVVGGTQQAAEVTIAATAAVLVDIVINNISPGTHYTLGGFVCGYNGGASTVCDSSMQVTSVASAPLLIGATMTRNAVAMTPGADNGTFDVDVTYN